MYCSNINYIYNTSVIWLLFMKYWYYWYNVYINNICYIYVIIWMNFLMLFKFVLSNKLTRSIVCHWVIDNIIIINVFISVYYNNLYIL